MKRILSVLLAVLMVFTTTVMAAPVSVSTVESVQEDTADGITASGELEAVKTVKAGINMLTGTKEPLTGETTTDAELEALAPQTYAKVTFTVGDDPLNVNGKVLKWHFPVGRTSQYPSLNFEFGGKLADLLGHTYLHFSFDFAKVVEGITDTNYVKKKAFWIMNTSTQGTDIARDIGAEDNKGWQHFSEVVDLTKGGTLSTKEPTSFRFEAEISMESTIPSTIYFDNLLVVPAHKITYVSEDGNTVYDTEYVALDDNDKVITSFTPAAVRYGNDYVPSWSLTKGGEAIASIDLTENEYTFYAVNSSPVIDIRMDGTLGNIGDEAMLVPTVVPAFSELLNPAKGQWTVEDETIISLTKKNNGSAEITALKEGSTKVTFAIDDTVAEYIVDVVLPYELDIDALNDDVVVINDINPGAFTAMVINLAGSAEGDEFKLYYTVDDNETGTVALEAASTSARDYYIDLTQLAGWVDGSSLKLQMEAGNTTVNSIKLYSIFEDNYEFVINPVSALLTVPGEELDITVDFKSTLNGVYTGNYTLEITDADDVASVVENDDGTAKIRAKVGTGIVSVKVTSVEKPEYSITKNIYVNVDSSKYGMYYDFLEAKTPADANIKQYGDEEGNTAATIVDGKLHLERSAAANDNGGIEPLGTFTPVSADKKYVVVKTDGGVSWLKFFYKWDNNSHSDTNAADTTSAGSMSYENDDGTKTFIIPFANIPDTAENITGFIMQINAQTTADIYYMYLTNEMPIVAYTWDFSTTTFNAGSGNHFLTEYDKEAGTVNVTRANANLGSGVVRVSGSSATITDEAGKSISVIKLTKNDGGFIGPSSKPTGLILNDYPYIWIKYKANETAKLSLFIADTDSVDLKDGSSVGTQWDRKDISIPASEEYTTIAFNLKDLGYSASLNTAFSGMMYAYCGESIISNVQYDEEGGFYYYIPPATFSQNASMTIDEISFANYNPFVEEGEEVIPLEMAVILTADKEAITTDGDSVTITPTVYANQKISTDAVTWKIDKGSAKIKENDDGTITITATGNGDVTITATAVEDSAFSASITISVTGQRKKVTSYKLKYYALGNSYLAHGPFQGWIWTDAEKGNRGMAATTYEKDYYHRVQYYLTNADSFKATIDATRANVATIERIANYDKTAINPVDTVEEAIAAVKSTEMFTQIKDYLIEEKPNVITVQLAENFSAPYNDDIIEAVYDTIYGMIDVYRPEESVVVVMTPFATGSKPKIIKEYAEKYGFYVADMSDVPSYSVVDATKRYFEYDGVTYDRGVTNNDSWKYNPYFAWEDHPYYDTYREEYYAANNKYPTEFRTHPGDKGMDLIGQRMFEQFEKAIPTFLDAEYVYIPTAITIAGDDAITEQSASITLTAVPAENDASNEVIWSVDKESFATITADGVLTAKTNGTVVVTAVSAYNSEIMATKTVTISGQSPVYTLKYDAGTTDEVTNLPEADVYARGEYTLSTTVPERNGYKFLGWTLEDGTNVTELTVNKDTTVYASWTFAEGWHFDNDGDFEGVEFSGFNTSVANGLATVVHYGDGVVVADNTLLINSDLFCQFNVKMAVTGSTAAENIVSVLINTTEGTHTFEAETTALGEQLLYTFDLSAVTGTITGFSIAPSSKDATAVVDWIEFERCALDEDTCVDQVNVVDEYTVDANSHTFTIDTLYAPEGTTTTLEDGTFVIGEIVGEGEVNVSGVLIINGENAPAGYVEVEVGEKATESNVRYAEFDGKQYAFEGNTYGMLVAENETKLVQIVEKSSADSVLTVATDYYLVTADGAVAVDALSDSVNNVEDISLRVKDPVGVRFKAGIAISARDEETAFEVTEYGYVIALKKDLVNAGEQLTLDFARSVSGSAYIKADGTDIIYENNGSEIFFTGVLHGIPENSYGVKLVAKTFTKLTINGKEYVVYGEPMTVSAYQVAKLLENSTELDESAMEIVNNIIDKAENGKDTSLDSGDLF